MRQYIDCENTFTQIPGWTPGCWVNVECPDNADFNFLTQTLGIPETVLAYANDIDERPRIERDDPWVLTILRIPARSDNPDRPIYTIPIAIISGPSTVVTVCYYKNNVIQDFIIHSRSRRISVTCGSTFILRLIYSSAFWYLEFLKLISGKVTEAEKQLARSVKNSDLMQLMQLQKALVYFNTSLRGNEVLIGRLRHVFTDEFDLDLLEDVEIELKQALNTVSVYSEILSGTLDTYASVISNNVNVIMKRMTSVTIVMMIPTLIASFYGMNVVIDLSSSPYAFWIIVTMAAALTAGTILLLRRIHWF